MENTFFLVDDDAACRRMLARIIEDEVGEVVGEAEDGLGSELAIINSQARVVIIDLLMPGQDGIETALNLKSRGYGGAILMLSQVDNKEMIAAAYQAGIEFFIQKPLNKVEVLSVLQRVLEKARLHESLSKVRASLLGVEGLVSQEKVFNHNSDSARIEQRANFILHDLGIAGESGSIDIREAVRILLFDKEGKQILKEGIPIKNLLSLMSEKCEGFQHGSMEVRAIEQRMRRSVAQAMDNIAALGLEDYHDPKFERYSTRYFEFQELRLQMQTIIGNSQDKGRVNLKKFLSALVFDVQGDESL